MSIIFPSHISIIITIQNHSLFSIIDIISHCRSLFIFCLSFNALRTIKKPVCYGLDVNKSVRILGHTSKEIAINYGVPQGSPISLLLFLLYMSKLPKLLPNTRRSLFADDFMIYSESSHPI